MAAKKQPVVNKEVVKFYFATHDLPETLKGIKAWFDERVEENVPVRYRPSVRFCLDGNEDPYMEMTYLKPLSKSKQLLQLELEQRKDKRDQEQDLRDIARIKARMSARVKARKPARING